MPGRSCLSTRGISSANPSPPSRPCGPAGNQISHQRSVGAARIQEAIRELKQYASNQGATIAFESIQHGEVGFHNTIAEVVYLVRGLNLLGLQIMIDTFHMNIEEKDMVAPLAGIRDILAHVHFSETNRNLLGEGHWPTAAFLDGLARIGYQGYCSVGVYKTRRTRRECIQRCMAELRHSSSTALFGRGCVTSVR